MRRVELWIANAMLAVAARLLGPRLQSAWIRDVVEDNDCVIVPREWFTRIVNALDYAGQGDSSIMAAHMCRELVADLRCMRIGGLDHATTQLPLRLDVAQGGAS